ncbi:MAG: MBL fold metallo-hydrolase [Micrococcales bacterium]|nr:MAG: MBL fold metallo-hydrolase [Micrococcales bacterium]
MVTIIPIETPSLGDRSYLAHDGSVAIVVDPQRDIDRIIELAESEGVRIAHVFETHIHNDYVTGGFALAQQTGAAYYVNADDPVSYERTPIRDGDVIEVSPSMSVQAIATPGHTFTHLSYALSGEENAVFTGGSLLFGSTGRPDLLGADHTHTLAHHQYQSAQRLAQLGDGTKVMPTHGFGSFCSATETKGQASTIGREKQLNPVLTKDEQAYVDEVVAGLSEYPAYYAHMAPANTAGPGAPDLSTPTMADKDELRRRLEAGEWLVDLRERTVFAAGYMPGTFNFSLDDRFATYLGWMIPWGTPVTLLGESPEQVSQAQRDLVRIGIDRPAAAATGGPKDWTDQELGSFELASFADLGQVRHHRKINILDVRRASEFAQSRLEGAQNIPLHELLDRIGEIPDGEVWVHCASGYRSSIAASIIAAHKIPVVSIDDDFGTNADKSGLPLVSD